MINRIIRQTMYEESGFTLLELIIAMTILSIGLLGIAGLQLVAIRGNATGNHWTLASAAMTQKIDELRTMPYDTLKDENDKEEIVKFVERLPYVISNAPTDGSFYMKRTTLIEVDTPVENATTVTINLDWQAMGSDGGQKTRTATFDTIISNPNI